MSHCFVEDAIYDNKLYVLNTPRCVAWYLDFSSCSTVSVLRDGLSLRFARAFASILTGCAKDIISPMGCKSPVRKGVVAAWGGYRGSNLL